MQFSSHNVALPGGEQTAPGRPLVAATASFRAALNELDHEFGTGPHARVSVADVGCLEGGYAAGFARAGYNVTGIEVRQGNYDAAMWLASELSLPNLRFIQGDARKVLPGMEFDAVFCCGLLYHLDRPAEFLNLLGQVTQRMLILNTHVSMEGGHDEGSHLPTSSHCELPAGASFNEGQPGHWYYEEDDRYASYTNTKSFWLTKDALLACLLKAGFGEITENTAWHHAAAVTMPWGSGGATGDRVMLTAYKEGRHG